MHSRPERVEWAKHHNRNIEGAGVGLRHHVGADLGSRVGRLALQRVGFADRHGQGGAINLAGRGMHYALGIPLTGGFEHIHGAQDVGFDIGLGGCIGVRDGDQCGEMKHDGLAAYDPVKEGTVANIAADELELASNLVRQVIQPPVAVERIVESQRRHIGAAANQRFSQMRAYEAIRPGDQYPLTLVGHVLTVLALLGLNPANAANDHLSGLSAGRTVHSHAENDENTSNDQRRVREDCPAGVI